MTSSTSQQIAKILLETKAVKLSPKEPFKWSSGWNSPIYCDNRVTLSFTKERKFIKEALAQLVKDKFPEVEAIAGVATAGIAQGALVAEELDLPFLYVRPEPKKHGMKNCIEGAFSPNQKIVLIEDLISTGGSSIKAANNLIEAGAVVLGIAATVTYSFATADDNFTNANIKLECLSGYNDLIDEALNMDYVSAEDVSVLKEWRLNPSEWGN